MANFDVLGLVLTGKPVGLRVQVLHGSGRGYWRDTHRTTRALAQSKLHQIFTRVCERGLSLSTSKSKFFMMTAVFAGATVGPKGVQPDLSKLTAIVNWKTPETALNLASFLGLTGWFRDLIKDYAKIETLLRNLIREVDLPDWWLPLLSLN